MKVRALVLSVVLGVVALGGCSRGPGRDVRTGPARAPQAVTITVWDWHSADPTKGVGLWLAEVDKKFQQAHPEIKINHVGQPHTEYYALLKAAAAAAASGTKEGPDVVMVHTGSATLDQKGNLAPLNDYITPDLRKKVVGWETVADDFDASKTIWAVPVAVNGDVWYYNKKLLAQAGLDPNKPPRTWDELLAACDAARRIGKAGIAAGQKEGYWTEWFVSSAAFQTCDPSEMISQLLSGQKKWTDPAVLDILKRLDELVQRGCFQKGVLSTPLFPDAGETFMRGDAAFFLGLISDVAHWKEFSDIMGEGSLGVMTCPVFKPGPLADRFPAGGASAYGIAKWSPHPKEAFEYVSFVTNDENAVTFLTQVGSFPANQTYDESLITNPTAKTIAGWFREAKAGADLLALAPQAVVETFRRQGQLIFAGKTTPQKALEAVEATAVAERKRGQ
jgi:raffinose/stachyose/melibiose transport system substrate-binding protein